MSDLFGIKAQLVGVGILLSVIIYLLWRIDQSLKEITKYLKRSKKRS